MFEAHFTKAEDFQGLETVVYSWKKTYHRRHKLSFQPLKIWFALGKRRVKGEGVKGRTFIYIEYQDEQENNRYCCLEATPEISVVDALDLAMKSDLTKQ